MKPRSIRDWVLAALAVLMLGGAALALVRHESFGPAPGDVTEKGSYGR